MNKRKLREKKALLEMQNILSIVQSREEGILSSELCTITNLSLRQVTRLLQALRNKKLVFSKIFDEKRNVNIWTAKPIIVENVSEPIYEDFEEQHSAWLEKVKVKKPRYDPWGPYDAKKT